MTNRRAFLTKTPIEDLDLSVRSYTALKRGSVDHVETLAYILMNHGERRLLKVLQNYYGIGKASYKEITNKVNEWINKEG